MILRKIKQIGGITLGGRNSNKLKFANDTVFIAETEKSLTRYIKCRCNKQRREKLN